MLQVEQITKNYRYVYFYPTKDAPKHIGSCSIHIKPGKVYELWCLGILGRFRGQGYGKQMVAEIVRRYRRYGTVRLYVKKTNARAIHIYRQAGFRISGEYDGSVEAWQMDWVG